MVLMRGVAGEAKTALFLFDIPMIGPLSLRPGSRFGHEASFLYAADAYFVEVAQKIERVLVDAIRE